MAHPSAFLVVAQVGGSLTGSGYCGYVSEISMSLPSRPCDPTQLRGGSQSHQAGCSIGAQFPGGPICGSACFHQPSQSTVRVLNL